MTKSISAKIKELVETQGQQGNWDYDEYMCGLFNGLELARSVADNDDPPPAFRSKPDEGWRRNRSVDGYVGAPVSVEGLAEAQDSV